MRKGPYPLSVHIGMATSSWPVLSNQKELALLQEMSDGIQKMLQGIQQYQSHPYRPKSVGGKEVWRNGTVSVRRYGDAKGKRALLLVPSLINGSSIFDLCTERSFASWLEHHGMNVYLLDWGAITNDAEQSTMDALVLQRLVPAIQAVCEMEEQPVNVLGYCMGGTMMMAAAKHVQHQLARMVMLATPWDFHAGSQDLLHRVQYWAPSAMTFINSGQDLPVEGIQTLFASLDPAMAARKFIRFVDMPGDSEEAKLFVAVEDWLNDGVALPAAVAKHCIEDWFFENKPGQGAWSIGGELVDPQAIAHQTLIVTSHRDKLVEYDSAAALAKALPNAEILDTDCGHIGMIAGQHSVKNVWQPIADWLLSD